MTDTARWNALNVLCLGVLMIVLDVTVANVALPAIQEDLDFTQSSLAWVINAYMIAFAGLLLLSGRMGDLVGRRRVFVIGLVVFSVASALCGFAQTREMLVAARFLQGAGGAMSSAVALGIIITLFPEPADRAKALGRYAFVASAGGSVGLLAGGVLTGSINWHWIFFINVPIGIVTVLLSMRLLDADAGVGMGDGMDIPGAVLITSALMLGVYTIVEPAAKHGWSDGLVLGLGAGAIALLGLFILREATAKDPLVPLHIFRIRSIAVANVVQVLSVAGMFSMFFLGALYIQGILGYDPLHTGLAFLPATAIMGVLSWRYSARLVTRFGAWACLMAGLVLTIGALLLFAVAPVDGEYVRHVLPVMLLLGFGGGISFPALMNLAMAGATPDVAGLASGVVGTAAQIGGALGLAVLATVAADRTQELVAGGTPLPEALTSGYHVAFTVSAGLVAVGTLVAFGLRNVAPPAVGHHGQDAIEPAPMPTLAEEGAGRA
ncbi:MAG: drug resistance transporter, EmrB/QacA subfamily [Thermoleophilia bacterium]|nr:drug resistance transporter, EmrB/QacA subfamily [Thermoleophilia bacterium]